MGYNEEKWRKRLSNRSDITSYLTHLTRSVVDEEGKIIKSTVDVLLKILNDKKLLGSSTSSGFIVGTNTAVCFQEAPLYGIGQNVLHEQDFKDELGGKVRYYAAGLAFSKPYVFNRGARPVIYEKTNVAKNFLSQDEWYRIVNLDLSDKNNIVDWTHEREWRMKGDFSFGLESATVLLPNQKLYQSFIEKADKELLKEIRGIVVMNNIIF